MVSITIVTFNSAGQIRRSMDSVFSQDYARIEVIVIDNGSTDGTREILEKSRYPLVLEFNKGNRGFCGGQNQAIRRAQGDWILCLNPDTRLEPGVLSELLRAGELDRSIGAVCPKILRLESSHRPAQHLILDSTGVYFTRSLRHFDRGSGEVDRGQYDTPEYVFGFTGAAVLLRRAMIEDVSVNGEFFDEDFFAYREDADVSWRAQLLGWRCLYTPYAVAYHARRVFPNNRRSLPAYINMHSTKNRFLMRVKNITPAVYRKVFFKTTLRDLGILGYVLLREWGSLPGLGFVLKNWKRTWAKRGAVQKKRRVGEGELKAWFGDSPVTFPMPARAASRFRTTETISSHDLSDLR